MITVVQTYAQDLRRPGNRRQEFQISDVRQSFGGDLSYDSLGTGPRLFTRSNKGQGVRKAQLGERENTFILYDPSSRAAILSEAYETHLSPSEQLAIANSR